MNKQTSPVSGASPSTRLLDQCSTLVGNEIRFIYNSHKEAYDALNKARAEQNALEEVAELNWAIISDHDAFASDGKSNFVRCECNQCKSLRPLLINLATIRSGSK